MPAESHRVTVYASDPSLQLPRPHATALLHVWLDLVLNAPTAGPPVYCPRCRALATAVTLGRGEPAWFRPSPCGCLIEIMD